MPLHIMSYDTFELGARDALAILFKDMTTGQKFVQTIDKPKYEVYVVKPEYRSKVNIMEAWMEQEFCDKVTVSYHWRDRELAEYMHCHPNDVKYSPWLYGYDVPIETWYWTQFLLEYGNDLPKKVDAGFFDIESDIIQQTARQSQPGTSPTSAITFIPANSDDVYTFVLTRDCLPVYAETHPMFQEINEIRENFKQQVQYFSEHLTEFIAECHANFDESYGVRQYHIMLFDDEIRLHQAFWEIVRNSGVDFMMAWNLPYDARNLIERPLVLGYEPESLICDDDFKYKVCFFEEDDNIQAHKRNHKCIISLKLLMLCQMWMYAGLRVAEGRQSLKLTVVGKKEVGDEKLDYSEEGNIRTFRYKNFWKYIMYNIKDVLLQLGIYRETEDIENIYERCYDAALLLPSAFVSTNLLTNSFGMYLLENGYAIGTNANRILPPFDYKQYFAEETDEVKGIDALLEDAGIDPDDADFYEDDMMGNGDYADYDADYEEAYAD